MLVRCLAVLLMFCCVLDKSYGQEPVPWQCYVDHQVACWELYQALPQNDPSYFPEPELREYYDPNDPVNGSWPPNESCDYEACVGPANARKCETAAVFFPKFPPGADYWQMATPATLGERGYMGLEPPYQGATPCAEIWECFCELNANICSTGNPVQWIPVESEVDHDSERCDGTVWETEWEIE